MDLSQQSNVPAFLMLSRLVIAFLQASFNFMAAVTIRSILEPKRVVSHYFHCFLCLLRNLYTNRKQQLELDMEQQTGSK